MSLTITPVSPLASSALSQDSVRVITFTIANHQLALPMNAIAKVVNCPPQIAKSASNIELFHFGNHSITVLNLHNHFKQPTTTEGKFLVVTKQKKQELYALLVDTPPDLMDVSISAIRQLPESYRQRHSMSIASCVVVLPQVEDVTSIFVIDMEKAIRTFSGNNLS
jgi:chemotaxis protein histidine kinase CheA